MKRDNLSPIMHNPGRPKHLKIKPNTKIVHFFSKKKPTTVDFSKNLYKTVHFRYKKSTKPYIYWKKPYNSYI